MEVLQGRYIDVHAHKLTSQLDLCLIVAADDRVSAWRLTPVESCVLSLHLGYLQLHLVILEPHHRDVARRNALAERCVWVVGIEGGDHLNPLSAGISGHHPLEILPFTAVKITKENADKMIQTSGKWFEVYETSRRKCRAQVNKTNYMFNTRDWTYYKLFKRQSLCDF